MGRLAFRCGACGEFYDVDLARLPPGGGRTACRKCAAPLQLYPDGRVVGGLIESSPSLELDVVPVPGRPSVTLAPHPTGAASPPAPGEFVHVPAAPLEVAPPPQVPFCRDLPAVLVAPLQGAARVFGGLVALYSLGWALRMTVSVGFIALIVLGCELGLCMSVILAAWTDEPDAMTPWAQNGGAMGLFWRILRVYVALIVAAAFLVSLVAAVVGVEDLFTGPGLAGLFVAAIAYLFVMPACAGTLVINEEPALAFNPVQLARTVRGIGPDYYVLVGVLVGLACFALALAVVLSEIPWVGGLLSAAVNAYLTVVACTMLGRTFRFSKERLGW